MIPGVPGEEGVGVAIGAGDETVHPAMIVAATSRLVRITENFNDMVPRLLSEAITIVIVRVALDSPHCTPGTWVLASKLR